MLIEENDSGYFGVKEQLSKMHYNDVVKLLLDSINAVQGGITEVRMPGQQALPPKNRQVVKQLLGTPRSMSMRLMIEDILHLTVGY